MRISALLLGFVLALTLGGDAPERGNLAVDPEGLPTGVPRGGS